MCCVLSPLFLFDSLSELHSLIHRVCLDSLNAAAVCQQAVGFKMLEYFLFVFFSVSIS